MDNTEILAAAILTAAFVGAERQPLHSGRLDESLREKFLEYLLFVREHTARPEPAARRASKRKRH